MGPNDGGDAPWASRLRHGAAWSLAGAGFYQGAGFLSMILAARMVGSVRFGELAILLNTVQLAATAAGFGLAPTATKHVSEWRGTRKDEAGRVMGLALLVAVSMASLAGILIAAAAAPIATHVLAAPHLAPIVRTLSGLVFLSALNGVLAAILLGLEAFDATAMVSAVRAVVLLSGMAILAPRAGVGGAIAALTVASAVEAAANLLMLARRRRAAGIPIRFDSLHMHGGLLLSFSLPAFLSGISTSLFTWVAGIILVHRADGFREMGIYNAANQIRPLLLFIPAVIASVNIPLLSSLWAKGDLPSCRRILVTTVGINAVVTLPLSLLVFLMQGPFMGCFGSEFHSQGTVLTLVIITVLVVAIQVPVSQILTATGRMWLGLTMNLGWGAVLILATCALVRANLGAAGLAGAFLIAYLFHALWTLGFAVRFLRSDRPDSPPFRRPIDGSTP